MSTNRQANVEGRFRGPSRRDIEISNDHSPVEFWVQRGANDTTIVALSEDASYLYRSSPPRRKFREAWRSLKHGIPVEQALDTAIAIPYTSIERVESNLCGLTVTVSWVGGRVNTAKETTVDCADNESRDEILAALHRRFGEFAGYDLRKHGRLRAARGPLLFIAVESMSLGVILIFTAVQGNPRLPVVRGNWLLWLAATVGNLLLDVFGPFGLIWLFGALTVWGIVEFIARIRNPPILLVLTPADPAVPTRRSFDWLGWPFNRLWRWINEGEHW